MILKTPIHANLSFLWLLLSLVVVVVGGGGGNVVFFRVNVVFFRRCEETAKLLTQEKRVLDIPSPCYVLGDIHGNLDDLRFFSQRLWTLGMHLTGSNFLFMGDYVDRGMYGIEVIMYLFAYKIKVPHKVFLLRGNHETRSVNGWIQWYKHRCFLSQCRQRFGRYGDMIWEKVNQVFDCLPFAATIDQSIFCVHGGIPPRETSLKGNRIEQMLKIPVPVKIPFPSEHLSGAIDSEAEDGEEEEEEEKEDHHHQEQHQQHQQQHQHQHQQHQQDDVAMASVKETGEEEEEEENASQFSSCAVPITQPQDDSQESWDGNEEEEEEEGEEEEEEEEEAQQQVSGSSQMSEEEEEEYHTMASQATQVFASQGSQESSSQMSDWNDDEEEVAEVEEVVVEEVAEVKEEETEEEKKERQERKKRLYQRYVNVYTPSTWWYYLWVYFGASITFNKDRVTLEVVFVR